MENPKSNAKIIGTKELVDSILGPAIQAEQVKINRTNFRAALAGEIMATLSAAAYTIGIGQPIKWDIVASKAIAATDALIAKLEEK